MTSPSGLPTNAVFGFVRDLLYLRKRKPDYLVCAFDRPEPTFRSDLYPDYKAHREPPPDDLIAQLPLIERAAEALNIPVVSHPRYEADDVLATLARAAAKRGLDVYLCTSDKDCRQLIDDHVRLYNLRKRQEFGRAELLADWGVTPEQVVDLQSLVGDAVDNVPGVPGVGVKTAAKLLQEFGTLDNLLANVDRVAGAKRQENLRAAEPIIDLSRQLVRLADDVPVALDWDAWRLRDIDAPKMLDLCRELGFRSLAARDPRTTQRPPARAAEPVPGRRGVVPVRRQRARPSASGRREPADQARPAGSRRPLADAERNAADRGRAVVPGLSPRRYGREIRGLLSPIERARSASPSTWRRRACGRWRRRSSAWPSAGGRARRGTWRCAGRKARPLLDPTATLERLRPIFEDPKIAKLNQNIKYDLLVLRGRGVEVRGVAGDPMVADYLLHAGERSHNLEELARRYLNHQVIPITDLIGKKTKKQPQLRMDQVPVSRSRPTPARTPTWPGGCACTWNRGWTGRRCARSTTKWKCR